MFFYLKCVTSREKFPGGETNLSRLLERAAVLPQGQEEEKSPEELAVASLLQLVAVALGSKTFRVVGLNLFLNLLDRLSCCSRRF